MILIILKNGVKQMTISEKIRFERVTKSFAVRDTNKKGVLNEFTAVQDLSFTVREGEFITLVGPAAAVNRRYWI